MKIYHGMINVEGYNLNCFKNIKEIDFPGIIAILEALEEKIYILEEENKKLKEDKTDYEEYKRNPYLFYGISESDFH